MTVVADVNNSIRPGLFKGSWDGVKAWGDYINSKGGLACRKVVVKEGDSKLSPTDSTNAISAACANSVAMVGTTALFLQDVTPMETCKDKAGATTGIPDLALLQTEPAQQCSAISFAALGLAASCPYSGTGPRTFRVGYTAPDFYFKKYGADALHGVFVIPKDLPVDDRGDDAGHPGPEQDGDHERRRVRQERYRDPDRLHGGRAGAEVAQLHVRPQRSRLQGHRVDAQGGAGPGRQHRQGLGLHDAVLRQRVSSKKVAPRSRASTCG